MNNKYSNILTMVLVILIVAILGILGYFAYDFFYAKSVSNNADSALEEFKNLIEDKLIDKNDVLALFNALKQNTNSKK